MQEQTFVGRERKLAGLWAQWKEEDEPGVECRQEQSFTDFEA